jgi:protein involved in polysaccharide export with SLBB domain
MNTKKTLFLLFFIFSFFSSFQTIAQINQQNLANVKVDELSETQIREISNKLKASGLPDSKLEEYAAARGMKPSEIVKLRSKVDKLNNSTYGITDKEGTLSSKDGTKSRTFEGESDYIIDNKNEKTLDKSDDILSSLKSKIFGKDLFSNSTPTFEPNLRLATPVNYILGTGDQLLIDIYGYSEVSYNLTISPEGSINIPYAGLVSVSGLTIEAARSRIKSKLSAIYSGLNSGNTKLSIALGNIKSIKVIINGEVTRPGTYTLPSLATAFIALYSSGGPSYNGSLRNIEIIREGKKIAKLDVYDFILNGDLTGNVVLRDQDIINIPTYQKRVEIVGEVKRPAIFELKQGEDFNDLLKIAGGFTENAYKSRIKVLKTTDTERKIQDITLNEYDTYIPKSGDKYFVNQILDRFQNRVSIEGAVFRPGQYELDATSTVKSLIQKAEGLKEDAFKNRAYITRLSDDLSTELIAFDVTKILSGKEADIPLKREDMITISSIFDLKEEYMVTINGEVRKPGEFPFSENMSLQELIIKSGGFKESATSQRIEISRRVKNSDANSKSAITAEVFQISINQNLSAEASNFVLQPFDIVTVRSAPGYEIQKQVRVDGEVLYPGYYTITKKDERLSDLIKRAGGLTALAYKDGSSLKRAGNFKTQIDEEKEILKLDQFKNIQKNAKDSTSINIENVITRNNFVGIDLEEILDNPGKRKDLFLQDGDILNIPIELQTVKVSGEVLSPNTIIFAKNRSFRNYIANAGGFGDKALKRRAYIIYANGSVRSTKKFLFFNNYPIVKTGSEIFVPKNTEKRKLTAGEIVGITSGIASFGAILLGVLNLLK